MLQTITNLDDRGSLVEIGPERWASALDQTEPQNLVLLQAMGAIEKRVQDRLFTPSAVLAFLTSIVVALVVSLFVLSWLNLSAHAGWVIPIVLVLGYLPAELFIKKRERSRLAASIVRTLLDHGRCPSCTYSLIELETEADGRVVCPECGAAWSRERVRQPTRTLEDIAASASLGPEASLSSRFGELLSGRGAITDATGRVFSLSYPALRGLPAHRLEELGEQRIRQARRRVMSIKGASRRIIAALCSVGAAAFLGGMIYQLANAPRLGGAPITGFSTPLGAITAVLLWGGFAYMLSRSPWGVPRD